MNTTIDKRKTKYVRPDLILHERKYKYKYIPTFVSLLNVMELCVVSLASLIIFRNSHSHVLVFLHKHSTHLECAYSRSPSATHYTTSEHQSLPSKTDAILKRLIFEMKMLATSLQNLSAPSTLIRQRTTILKNGKKREPIQGSGTPLDALALEG
jgi:hypothetical protein